jgi:alpha-glucosidase
MTFLYQIFPDRFAIGGGLSLEEKRARVDVSRFEVAPSWDARPRPVGNELFLGDLDGITGRMDHVRALGASALYLTPIFDAPSSHRYDARSYRDVDARLGGDAAFERLARACKGSGLGLVLDAVFNHTGEEHPWVRGRPDFYARDAAGKNVPWRGYGHLPELRLEEGELRYELFTGPESVVRAWLRKGATGWRIDCANDCGLDACAQVTKVAREEGARDGVVGEVMSWAVPFLASGALDGVMNYWFREGVIALLQGEVPVEQASAALALMATGYPLPGLLRSWNMLGSHDTPRIKTTVGERTRAAFLLAFTFPGIPHVYYGDEIGMEGDGDPDCRRAMPWDRSRWDMKTLAWVKRLAEVRGELRALREGRYVPIDAPGGLAFARATDDPRETVVVVLNPTAEKRSYRLFAPRCELFDSLPLVDRLGGSGSKMRAGTFALALEAGEGAILVPEPREASGYDYYKRMRGV